MKLKPFSYLDNTMFRSGVHCFCLQSYLPSLLLHYMLNMSSCTHKHTYTFLNGGRHSNKLKTSDCSCYCAFDSRP